jgi:hypothetical protein
LLKNIQKIERRGGKITPQNFFVGECIFAVNHQKPFLGVMTENCHIGG